MSEITTEVLHIIREKTVKRLRKEALTIKKSQNIPHHEALNIAARKFDFNNWEHLQKSASLTAISEKPFRTGFVIAMDIKDATEHPPSKSTKFVKDDQISALLYMDYFTEKGYTRSEDLNDAERYFLEDLEVNYVYFRYTGITPKTIERAFKIAEKDFFFSPVFVWLKGQWHDMFGEFDYDKYLEGDEDDDSF